jgi:hypothetical protein
VEVEAISWVRSLRSSCARIAATSAREAKRLRFATPVSLAQTRLELDRLAIGRNRIILPSRRLECVAVAEPDLGLQRVLAQQLLVEADGFVVFADTRQYGGLQVAETRAARIGREQLVDLCQGLDRLVVPVQYHGIVVPRGLEARRQFQAACQQALGVVVATDARGDLGQHADRRHVGRKPLQVAAQQRLGDGDTAFGQCQRRFHEPGVARRVADVVGVGLVGACGIAHRIQVITQRTPGIGHGWLQAHGRTQRRDGFLAAPGIAKRQPEFTLCGCPARLRGGQRLEDAQCVCDVVRSPPGHRQQQRRGRVIRNRAEDLACLLGSQTRLGHEQLFGVGQRHV